MKDKKITFYGQPDSAQKLRSLVPEGITTLIGWFFAFDFFKRKFTRKDIEKIPLPGSIDIIEDYTGVALCVQEACDNIQNWRMGEEINEESELHPLEHAMGCLAKVVVGLERDGIKI